MMPLVDAAMQGSLRDATTNTNSGELDHNNSNDITETDSYTKTAVTSTASSLLLSSQAQQDQQQLQQAQTQTKQTQRPTHCPICQRLCRPLRCQCCHRAWYCSVECQRCDWYKVGGHAEQCHRRGRRRQVSTNSSNNSSISISNNKDNMKPQPIAIQKPSLSAQDAWNELAHLVESTSLPIAQQTYHQSHDQLAEMKRIVLVQQQQQQQQKQHFPLETKKPSSTLIKTKLANATTTGAAATINSRAILGATRAGVMEERQVPWQQEEPPAAATPISTNAISCSWEFHVEHLSHVGAYQLLLRQRRLQHSPDPSLSRQNEEDDAAVMWWDTLRWDVTDAALLPLPQESATSNTTTQRQRRSRESVLWIYRDDENDDNRTNDVNATMLGLVFPGSLQRNSIRIYPPSSSDPDPALSIRLPYRELDAQSGATTRMAMAEQNLPFGPPLSLHPEPSRLTLNLISQLSCRHCRQRLFCQATTTARHRRLQDDDDGHDTVTVNVDAAAISTTRTMTSSSRSATIQRILPLPSARWHDMADYLQCSEPGQGDVFGASSSSSWELGNVATICTAKETVVLYDETALVVHEDDLVPYSCLIDDDNNDNNVVEHVNANDGFPEKASPFIWSGATSGISKKEAGNGIDRLEPGALAVLLPPPIMNASPWLVRTEPDPTANDNVTAANKNNNSLIIKEPPGTVSQETSNSSTKQVATFITERSSGGDQGNPPAAFFAPNVFMRGGSRFWQDSAAASTGGRGSIRSISCTICSEVLGCAPTDQPHTFRLWRHRLRVLLSPPPTTTTTKTKTRTPTVTSASDLPVQNSSMNECYPSNSKREMMPLTNKSHRADGIALQTIGSFVAHEMIRYADTQAIFSFCVSPVTTTKGNNSRRRSPSNNNSTTTMSTAQSLLWLRLVSWDGAAASSHDCPMMSLSSSLSSSSSSLFSWLSEKKNQPPRVLAIGQLQFHRAAKIVFYQVQDERNILDSNPTAVLPDDDIFWMWKSDLCCPPPSQSSVADGSSSSTIHRNVHDNDQSTKRQSMDPQSLDSRLNTTSPMTTASTSDPQTSVNHPASSVVRLELSYTDFDDLITELRQSSRYFTPQVVETTIRATSMMTMLGTTTTTNGRTDPMQKTATATTIASSAGLAMIALS